jgi:hypothetical protein
MTTTHARPLHVHYLSRLPPDELWTLVAGPFLRLPGKGPVCRNFASQSGEPLRIQREHLAYELPAASRSIDQVLCQTETYGPDVFGAGSIYMAARPAGRRP